MLAIDSEARRMRILSNVPGSPGKRDVAFDDIKEIESTEPRQLTIRLKSGEEIQLRGLDELYEALRALARCGVRDVTRAHVKIQIVEFEKRRLHIS